MVDDCEEWTVWLYNCKRLNQRGKWVRTGTWHINNGKRVWDNDIGLDIQLIANIFIVKSEYYKDIWVDDVLQFYIDPHHKPFLDNFECQPIESTGDKHSVECDRRLHEALKTIRACGWEGSGREIKAYENFQDAFTYIRQRLIMYGAKIP